ncbi:hypothetical protein K8B83_06435 [Shewanella inventionis]|uniref:Uncharacterized protein n=1 Tax=Shewanella inventionis TaxID=1738770 RepID=A0ABQ1IXY3_9GAMM|nr:hypothetical protein [Shewanella inventionis]MCL1157115.1 hypothetical protein [Shewanella inventionis]UAL44466.1 hypothetical protein K8B83_06435 [Shewanella inventionis]GGB55346.1 hypothetical protein GCM10011607_14890 [Shewanella inventionis]
MSADIQTEENLITQIWHKTVLKLKDATELLCLFAILSTYLFVMLKPNGIQNNKALEGQ